MKGGKEEKKKKKKKENSAKRIQKEQAVRFSQVYDTQARRENPFAEFAVPTFFSPLSHARGSRSHARAHARTDCKYTLCVQRETRERERERATSAEQARR